MTETFFKRLNEYYKQVAEVFCDEASAAKVFPNSSDIGASRERIYAEFLKLHLPSKCNVFFGGYLFDENERESKQLDIIITTDTAMRFNFLNKDGFGKSFSHVEGTLGVVSVKSNLDKEKLIDSLEGFASIPETKSLTGRINPLLTIPNYDDWPLKIIYSTKGINHEALLQHLNEFYDNNPKIPLGRRPNFIHVAGKYVIFRAMEGMSLHDPATRTFSQLTIGSYYSIARSSDLQAVVWILTELQKRAVSSSYILFLYTDLINKMSSLL